jgi:hypothetical protein
MDRLAGHGQQSVYCRLVVVPSSNQFTRHGY